MFRLYIIYFSLAKRCILDIQARHSWQIWITATPSSFFLVSVDPSGAQASLGRLRFGTRWLPPEDSVLVKKRRRPEKYYEGRNDEEYQCAFDWCGSGDDLHCRYKAAAFLFQLRWSWISTSGLSFLTWSHQIWREGRQLFWQIDFTWTMGFCQCF